MLSNQVIRTCSNKCLARYSDKKLFRGSRHIGRGDATQPPTNLYSASVNKQTSECYLHRASHISSTYLSYIMITSEMSSTCLRLIRFLLPLTAMVIGDVFSFQLGYYSPSIVTTTRTSARTRAFLSTTRLDVSKKKDCEFALLFDCDGVILETEELHRLAYNAAFKEFDLTIAGQPVEWSVCLTCRCLVECHTETGQLNRWLISFLVFACR